MAAIRMMCARRHRRLRGLGCRHRAHVISASLCHRALRTGFQYIPSTHLIDLRSARNPTNVRVILVDETKRLSNRC